MTHTLRTIALAAALIAAGTQAHATGTDRIRIELITQSDTITLTSTETGVARYEVSVTRWTQAGQSPTREVLAFPPVFEIQPGSKQAIKIMARVPRGRVEGTYRLWLRAIEGGTLTFDLPLFLNSTDQASRPDLVVTSDSQGVRVENRGDVTELLTHYRSADGSQAATMQYVLPHSAVIMKLPAGVKAVMGRNSTEYQVQQ